MILSSTLLTFCWAVSTDAFSINSKLTGRIMGGSEVDIAQAPWQVSIQTLDHFCGGAILNEWWILTAAHCIHDKLYQLLKVRVGSSNHDSGGKLAWVEQCVKNFYFDLKSVDFDYGLLKLKTPLQFDEKVQPIALPSLGEDVTDNMNCFVSGWGKMRSQTSDPRLFGVEIQIANQNECNKAYAYRGGISPRMVCAAAPNGGKAPSFGDSGGGLICDNKIFGLVSHSFDCGKPGYPAVFARVSAARIWIQRLTEGSHGYLPKPRLDGRIVGGFAMNITEVPWQVSLQLRGSHFCGGSIIGKSWILTAAHCTNVLHNSTEIVRVRIGSSSHIKDGAVYKVKQIVQHARFNRQNVDFDFALLELEDELRFEEAVQPVGLPDFGELVADNATCLVTGWGNTQNESESRIQLRGAYIPIVNQKLCSESYEDFGGVTSRMLCAGFYPEGGKDACQGDSGGPLVAFDGLFRGKPVQVGIVSWGYGCAKPYFPGCT